MHSLLHKYIKAQGIDVDELTEEEKASLDQWNAELADEVTPERIETFCRGQISDIEKKWRDLDNSTEKNERLILMHTVYKSILELFRASSRIREEREAYLRSLLLKK